MFAVNIKTVICSDTKNLTKNFWRHIFRNVSVGEVQSSRSQSRFVDCSAFQRNCKRPKFITHEIGNVTIKYSTLPPKPPSQSIKQPITWKTLFITLLGGSCLLVLLWNLREKKRKLISNEVVRSIGKGKLGGKFELVDQFNKPVSSDDLLGQWLLIYFGFTHCPDICPDEIEKMVQVVDILDAKKTSHKIKPLFITVDPERDSPTIVGKYVKEFSNKIIGLTGSKEQIASVCKAYRVYYSAGPQDVDKDYIVDHTIIIYLIDPNGKFVDYFGQTKTANDIANIIEFNMMKYDKLHEKGLAEYFGSLFFQK